MRRPLRLVLVAATFALVASFATISIAAPATWERVDITQHSEQGGGVLLVSGELPATASLPAEAELSVPAGSQLQWIGEILGGASADDPELKYTKTTVKGSDIYRFTLTKSRTAQIEVPITEGLAFDGTAYTSSLAWTANQDVPEVGLNLRVPQGAVIATQQAGVTLQPGDANYAFYTKTVKNAKAGDQLALAVAYSLPAVAAASAQQSAAASGSNSIVPIALVLLVLAAFVGLFIAVRRKMAGSPDDGEESASFEAARSGAKSSSSVEAAGAGARYSAKTAAAGSSAGRRPLTGKAKRNLVTAVITAVLIVAAVAVGMTTTRPRALGDTISQTYSSAEPCATAKIALTVPNGADPSKTAEAMFAAIKPIPGLTTATYNIKTGSIDIGYCESSSSEAALRQALATTGMVAAGGAPAGGAVPVPAQ
jgi:hypothetical protein